MTTEKQLDDIAEFLDAWDIPWNEEQLQLIGSVCDEDEHAIGQAVPGSGKTKVIVAIGHFLTHGPMKVSKDQILCCSFNTSCAELIRERLGRVAGISDRQFIKMSRTYHSVGFEACKKMGRSDLIGSSSHEVMTEAMNLHSKEFEPIKLDFGTVGQAISYAKNRGAYVLSPGKLDSAVYIPEGIAESLEIDEQQISSILRCYEKAKGDMIDFDDQITLPYQVYAQGEKNPFQHFHKLRYLLLDELQDANKAQMGMIKAIHDASGCKIIGVGDQDQCMLPDTQILTHNGIWKAIKDIKEGDQVITRNGPQTSLRKVSRVVSRDCSEGKIVHITTKSGKTISCTPRHICFAGYRKEQAQSLFFVYLMKRGNDYRIGTTRCYVAGDKGSMTSGLRARLRREKAEKGWYLGVYETEQEARTWEAIYAFQYGIPDILFEPYANQKLMVEKVFSAIDSEQGARRLMKDLWLFDEYPHEVPKSVGECRKKNLTVTLCGDARSSHCALHRLSFLFNDPETLTALSEAGMKTRSAKGDSYRVEVCRSDYREIVDIVDRISSLANLEMSYNANVGHHGSLPFCPASHVMPGMTMYNGEGECEVVESVVMEDYHGLVYDLDVDGTHNYIANDVCVHNSIYAWRGANIHNMEAFEKAFNAKFFPIPYNYRSGYRILDAASSVIKNNADHEDYVLKAGRKKARGDVIEVSTNNSAAEMDAMYEVIKSLTTCGDFENGPYRHHQITIIARTNQVLGHAARYLFSKNIPVIARMDDMSGEFNQVLNCVAACLHHPNADMRNVLQSIKLVGDKRAQKMTAFGVDLDDVQPEAIGKGKIARRVSELLGYLKRIRVPVDEAPSVYTDALRFKRIVDDVVSKLCVFSYDHLSHIGITMRQDLKDAGDFILEMADRTSAREAINMMYDMGDVDLSARRNDAIELMTAHKAKGQENNAVIILDGDNFPFIMTDLDGDEFHQEVNLLFVAMTRAKDTLVVMRHPRVLRAQGTETIVTSKLYDKVDWDDRVRWDAGEGNQNDFRECFPIWKKPKAKAKELRSWEKAEWPPAIKSFQGGKDFEAFKGQVAAKFEQDGCSIHFHQPTSKQHYDPSTLENRVQVLRDTAKEMLNSRAKGKDENTRNQDKHTWLTSGSKVLSDYLGDGWRPDIHRQRSWLRSISLQRDVIFDYAPAPGNGRTTETVLVGSLVLAITGHPRLQATLSLKMSHVNFSFCRNADAVDALIRYELHPITSPIGMTLWKSEKDWSKSIQPNEGFQSAIPYVIENLPEIQAITRQFDQLMNACPDWLFDLRSVPFHPGGHLWVHKDPDILWPIHPPKTLLIDHMGNRETYAFDYKAQQREQAFYDAFHWENSTISIDGVQPNVVSIDNLRSHVETTREVYRSLPMPAWEYIVARAFNTNAAGVEADNTGKRLQFNISPCPELSFPEKEFQEGMEQFIKKPVRFQVI